MRWRCRRRGTRGWGTRGRRGLVRARRGTRRVTARGARGHPVPQESGITLRRVGLDHGTVEATATAAAAGGCRPRSGRRRRVVHHWRLAYEPTERRWVGPALRLRPCTARTLRTLSQFHTRRRLNLVPLACARVALLRRRLDALPFLRRDAWRASAFAEAALVREDRVCVEEAVAVRALVELMSVHGDKVVQGSVHLIQVHRKGRLSLAMRLTGARPRAAIHRAHARDIFAMRRRRRRRGRRVWLVHRVYGWPAATPSTARGPEGETRPYN